MTEQQINDLKREHNEFQDQGHAAYALVLDLHKKCLDIQDALSKAEGDEYDPIPLIFGSGFWIDDTIPDGRTK